MLTTDSEAGSPSLRVALADDRVVPIGEQVRPPTELVLVRHAEAVFNLEFARNLDGACRGLTERGRSQAAALARRLAAEADRGAGFDAAYCSPIRRCVETAESVQPVLGVEFQPEAALRCADHGEQGRDPWDPAANAIGSIPPLRPLDAPLPRAESWHTYLKRSGDALLAIAERHPGGRVLIVAHGETSASAFSAFTRTHDEASRWFYPLVNHTAVTIWRRYLDSLPGGWPDGQWQLRVANHDGHLPPEDRTWA